MIDKFSSISPDKLGITANKQTNKPAVRKKDVHMVRNERTAGFIPSWSWGGSSANSTDINKVKEKGNNFRAQESKQGDFAKILADQQPLAEDEAAKKEFGFKDLVDMVNPLQHIPLVNYVYREITGDEIRPISKIIGGGIFGGPAGMAGGLVSVVVEEETGKDTIGHAVSLVRKNGDEKDNNIKAGNNSFASKYETYSKNSGKVLAANGRTAGYIRKIS